MLEADKLMQAEVDSFAMKGRVRAVLYGPDGEVKQDQTVDNLITTVGRQYFTKRAANIATLPGQVSGMKLGNDSLTVASVTGAGAALVTYIAASQRPLDAGYPTEAVQGLGSRVTWQATWAAGVATNADIEEVVIVNEATLTDATTAAANTIARAIIAQVGKGAGDTLVVTWTMDLGA